MNGLSPCSMEQARRSDVVSGALTVMDYAVFCTDMQMNMSVVDVVFKNRIKAILVVVVTINAERAEEKWLGNLRQSIHDVEKLLSSRKK